jgi:sugar/nucleoside kinase (ribokinase family)
LDVKKWLGKNIGIKCKSLTSKIKCIITNGANNITLIENEGISELKVPKVSKIEKTTGAGDSFSGTFLSMLLRGKNYQ